MENKHEEKPVVSCQHVFEADGKDVPYESKAELISDDAPYTVKQYRMARRAFQLLGFGFLAATLYLGFIGKFWLSFSFAIPTVLCVYFMVECEQRARKAAAL
jgi:hypothetical protein